MMRVNIKNNSKRPKAVKLGRATTVTVEADETVTATFLVTPTEATIERLTQAGLEFTVAEDGVDAVKPAKAAPTKATKATPATVPTPKAPAPVAAPVATPKVETTPAATPVLATPALATPATPTPEPADWQKGLKQ